MKMQRNFMESGLKTKKLRIDGMTCVNCQNKIERRLRNTAGIEKAAVSYSAGTAAVTYDTDIISLKDIAAIIQKLDYTVLSGNEQPKPDTNRVVGLLIIIVALYVLMQQFGVLRLLVPSRLAEANMEYGMLFVIGLITSVHCVAMCGGINLSQCIPQNDNAESRSRFAALRPAFLYNLGRIASYTAVGFIVGALGSVITFSNTAQGFLKLIAGVFMVVMGINMLGVFPWLRNINPRMPKIFAPKIDAEKSNSKSPLIAGLLNGLMPCGPLQAMQIYALSTGSPSAGALSMMLFSLGTTPLMFGLGALASILSKKFTRNVMTAGAVLVVVLGLSMFSQGWSLSDIKLPSLLPESSAVAQSSDAQIEIENGVQIVNSTLSSGRYPAITVQAGTPVKWTIDAPQGSVNGCNNRMYIPEYDIEHQFKTGANVIEFTPAETGKFPYSCWMGMIRSSITVVEAGTQPPDKTPADINAAKAAGDINEIEVNAVKEETGDFETPICPPAYFEDRGSMPCCS
jgi:sulfite exporter TauE/SafE/copper chaperone CopZ